MTGCLRHVYHQSLHLSALAVWACAVGSPQSPPLLQPHWLPPARQSLLSPSISASSHFPPLCPRCFSRDLIGSLCIFVRGLSAHSRPRWNLEAICRHGAAFSIFFPFLFLSLLLFRGSHLNPWVLHLHINSNLHIPALRGGTDPAGGAFLRMRASCTAVPHFRHRAAAQSAFEPRRCPRVVPRLQYPSSATGRQRRTLNGRAEIEITARYK